mmetsp:Transcript_9098/g.18998  ORF Transcript_9098/g.18998 Transcript_9098/m.18998 type:complete len:143 (-) Transcript_9098:481-909(-)
MHMVVWATFSGKSRSKYFFNLFSLCSHSGTCSHKIEYLPKMKKRQEKCDDQRKFPVALKKKKKEPVIIYRNSLGTSSSPRAKYCCLKRANDFHSLCNSRNMNPMKMYHATTVIAMRLSPCSTLASVNLLNPSVELPRAVPVE